MIKLHRVIIEGKLTVFYISPYHIVRIEDEIDNDLRIVILSSGKRETVKDTVDGIIKLIQNEEEDASYRDGYHTEKGRIQAQKEFGGKSYCKECKSNCSETFCSQACSDNYHGIRKETKVGKEEIRNNCGECSKVITNSRNTSICNECLAKIRAT